MLQGASCSHTTPRLADVEGKLEAGIHLPPAPPHCRKPVPHAAAKVGDNPVSGWKRETLQLDFANQRAANCWAWYDELALDMAAGQVAQSLEATR